MSKASVPAKTESLGDMATENSAVAKAPNRGTNTVIGITKGRLSRWRARIIESVVAVMM